MFIFLIPVFLVLLIAGLSKLNIFLHNKKAGLLKTPLNYTLEGAGQDAIIFLHGVAGSRRYWETITPYFSNKYQTVALDLLGYAESPWPTGEYGLEENLIAMDQTVSDLGIKTPFTIVAHSLGTHLAVRYALKFPKKVKNLVLIAPPIFHSRADAVEKLKSASMVSEMMAMNPIVAPFLCKFHEAFFPMFRWAMPYFVKDLPPHVAMDSVLHTWHSYEISLNKIILSEPWLNSSEQLKKFKILILHGTQDQDASTEDLKKLALVVNAKYVETKGGHNGFLQNLETQVPLVIDFIGEN